MDGIGSETLIPTTTGIKRKTREPTYNELVEEVKTLRAELKECRKQYKAVVPQYNKLWRQVNKSRDEIRILTEKNQGLVLDNNTLREIAWSADSD
jgi:ribosomal protein L19E